MTRRRWTIALLWLIWATMIFATSSTVITPSAFFAWLHENVFRDDEAYRTFQSLWGASWLFVVKGWHVLEFAILMLLGTRAIDALTARRSVANVLVAAAVCLAFAASDEWRQTFVPERDGLFSDFLIDTLGVVLAGLHLCRGRRGPAEE